MTTRATKGLICQACRLPASSLAQRPSDRKWVCFLCLPRVDVGRYPEDARQLKEAKLMRGRK